MRESSSVAAHDPTSPCASFGFKVTENLQVARLTGSDRSRRESEVGCHHKVQDTHAVYPDRARCRFIPVRLNNHAAEPLAGAMKHTDPANPFEMSGP